MNKKYIDHYIVLEVVFTSTLDEIKKAYRRLAMAFHPDHNPGDKLAEEKFKHIAESYEILSDIDKRKDYDNYTYIKSRSKVKEDFGYSFGGSKNEYDFSDIFSRRGNRSGWGDNTSDNIVKKVHIARLDVEKLVGLTLTDLYNNKPITVKYNRTITDMDSTFGNQVEDSAVIQCSDILMNAFYSKVSNKYTSSITIAEMGSNSTENKISFGGNFKKHLYGNLVIEIIINVPENIKIEGLNITERVDLSLHDLLFLDKIEVTTFYETKYNIKIKSYNKLDTLIIKIPEAGLTLNRDKGNYIFEFKVPALNITNLTDKELNQLKGLLLKAK